MKKRLLSLVLAWAVCLTMLPAVALAADSVDVDVYLRTLDSQTTDSPEQKNFVKIPEDQLETLGLKQSMARDEGYANRDGDGNWIFYAKPVSSVAATYANKTYARGSNAVNAVVEDVKTSLESDTFKPQPGVELYFNQIKSGVTWDTLSWSQNSGSFYNSWHLNGELHFYKAAFDLNYTGADNENTALTRYEVVGTNISSGLPDRPAREGYTFEGWYTAKDGGDAITSIPELTSDATYYAHWTEQTVQEHKHAVGENNEITFTAWDEENSLPNTAGSYYLTKNVTLSQSWAPTGTVTLCLNGHSITATGNFDAIAVSGSANLALTDCQTEQGMITHESGKKGRGVHVISGTFNMYGGNITGNTVDGTSLSNTTNNTTAGGGVRVAGGTFNMYGGSITNNKATANGGGIDIYNKQTLTMTGGTISGNESLAYGGGINTSNDTPFVMTGGTITGNTAVTGGGGVHLYNSMTLSGNVEIYDNYKGTQANKTANDNVYLDTKSYEIIIATPALNNQHPIGVTTQDPPSLNNPTAFATRASDNDKTHFTSDVSGYTVVYDSNDNGLYLKAHQWTYTANAENKTISAECSNCGEDGGTLTLSAAGATYDGNPHPATVTSDAWQAGQYTVTYGAALGTTAPTNAGDYTATLTMGNASVSVDYTIAKADSGSGTLPTAEIGLIYSGDELELIKGGSTSDGVYQYSIDGTQTFSPAIPKAISSGTYTVYYQIKGDANHKDGTLSSFEVTIAKKPITVPAASDTQFIYNGNMQRYEPKNLEAGAYILDNATRTDVGTQTVKLKLLNQDHTYWANPDNPDDTSDTTDKPYTFTINPAALTVTPNALSKTVGENDPELTYIVSGAQNDEKPAFEGKLSRTAGETVGTYEIGKGTLALQDNGTFKASNYTLALSTDPVSFTINARASSGGSHSSGSSTPKYAVTIPSGTTGGTAKSSVSSATGGSTVTITVTPADGYKVDKVSAADSKGNSIKVTDKGDNKYTFTMPSSKVTVTPTFSKIKETKPETIPFDDVSANDYFYDAVKWAADKGITGGVSSNLFAPEDGCTRAQIVTFLWRTAGSPEPKALSSFTDVPADAYYAKAVAWAVENGITVGTTDTTFSPDDICTRAHGVTFLYRAIKAAAPAGESVFTDVPVSAYYADAVKWATEQGITKGISSTLFGPDAACTRAQIVTFLYRLYGGK